MKKRRCQLGLTTPKVSGLWSLPDEMTINCLSHVSKLDRAALAIASKSHRSLVFSPDITKLRWRMDCLEPYLYVCMRISPKPTPRWFIFHPVQRLLKPVPLNLHGYEFPESSSSYVRVTVGVYVIGGLRNGKPTSDVVFFDCTRHELFRVTSMNMPRAAASASIVDGKIYVFGGCGDEADSSNWAEVYDASAKTWEFLSVSTHKLPLNIKHSVVTYDNIVYGVDEDGQDFSFSPSKCIFSTSGVSDSMKGYRDDWLFHGKLLFCRGSNGVILWSCPKKLYWKEVKGLEELQLSLCDLPQTKVKYDTKLCIHGGDRDIVIFWNVPEFSKIWSADISLEQRGNDMWGKIEWSGPVLNLDPQSPVEVLFADYVLL